MNIGCTSRGKRIHAVCRDYYFYYFYFAFVLLCALHLREGCRHDGPLSPYVHAVEPCVPLLFASPSSICVLVLRQGCVCGVRCMPGCCSLLMWCALCVCVCRTSRLLCCSPCPSLCRSAPHHRTTTLTMMMTCRLLCALLVLALCCGPYVCAAEGDDKSGKVGQGPKLQDSGGSSDSDNPRAKVTEGIVQSSGKEPI
ncbi:mucin TcMUCII, partial [Trypanosoma cruzi]